MLVAPNLNMPKETRMPLIKLKSSSIADSVDLRGIPTAPDAHSEIATTQMVRQSINDLIGGAPELLNTLGELANSLGVNNNQNN
jgi:hypothetical protein